MMLKTKKRQWGGRTHIFIQILFLHVSSVTWLHIFFVCEIDVCPAFVFVVSWSIESLSWHVSVRIIHLISRHDRNENNSENKYCHIVKHLPIVWKKPCFIPIHIYINNEITANDNKQQQCDITLMIKTPTYDLIIVNEK